MQFKFTVRRDRITRENNNDFIEGNKGYYEAVFDFGDDMCWEEAARLCVVECGKDVYRIPIIGGSCLLPVFSKGSFKIGVMGVDTLDGADLTTVISTNMIACGVLEGAANKEANAELNTAAEVWEKYLSDMEEKRQAAEESAKEAKASADAAAESAKSVLKIADMTVSAESLPEGADATVTKTEDEDTLHLTFGIPKGKKGDKGDKGEKGEPGAPGKDGTNGKTPVKGVDYFTEADIEEFNNAPKQVIAFANNPLGEMKFVSDSDGLKLVWDCIYGKAEYCIASWESDVVLSTHAELAYRADADSFGNDIRTTYATKEEVDTKIKSYVDEAILGGAW